MLGTNLDYSTLPFYFLTLAASSYSSGLWSLLNGLHDHIPTEFYDAINALESPAFAQIAILFHMSTMTAVVPLNIASILDIYSSFS
jgi:hypothetical protein